MKKKSGDDLAARVLKCERRALAKAITLVESRRDDERAAAEALIDALMPHTGQAVRIGLSGAPGVGKSTFIEAFGLHLTRLGHKVAVLAVDPSSARSGGSILGDKTRMNLLARDENAFIRPSPAGGALGGVARRTREAMLIVEAAGFDVVLVETVGVGQSETAVADMVDMFALLLAPGGGDDLQGIKRGIMELADLVVVNKADGDLEPAAKRAAADYAAAMHLMRAKYKNWQAPVVLASALEAKGMEQVWRAAQDFIASVEETGERGQRRKSQAKTWMWAEIEAGLREMLSANASISALTQELERQVASGAISPASAARAVLSQFDGTS